MSTTCDNVVIVGAGPAGIAAACAACESGASVTLLDDNPKWGGQIGRAEKGAGHSPEAVRWFERLARAPNLQSHAGWTVIGVDPPNTLLVVPADGERLVRMEYGRLILAVGARELFLPLPGWTLPGVFGAGGLQALVKGGWSIAERRIVVAGSGPLLLAVAAFLQQAGADVVLVAEQAPWRKVSRYALHLLLTQFAKFRQGVRLRGAVRSTPYRVGCWPVQIEGHTHVEQVVISDGIRRYREACDYVACGFGLIPNTELGELLGCERAGDHLRVDCWQRTSVAHVYAAGEVCGIAGVECALVEGQIAGFHAAGNDKMARRLLRKRDRLRQLALRLRQAFALRDELRTVPDPHTIVCRCEDVEFSQIRDCGTFREARLQHRCGMGLCQGRLCGPASEFLFGWKDRSVRPPLYPIRLGALGYAAHNSSADSSEVESSKERRSGTASKDNVLE